MKGIGGNLALASTVTLGLLGGHGVRPDLWPWFSFWVAKIPAWAY
jgi:hypothetical protein